MALDPRFMLEIALVGTAAVLGLVRWRMNSLPRAICAGLGVVIVSAGVACLALVELRYAPPDTNPVSQPLRLDRSGRIAVVPFVVRLEGPYDIWLQTDRTIGLWRFGCLTGEEGFWDICPGEEPELNIGWFVEAAGAVVANGGTDIGRWRRLQASVDPHYADLRYRSFKDYAAKSENPSDSSPLFHQLGRFRATAGRAYRLTVLLAKPAPDLAALHPRLTVGLGAEATEGLGVFALAYCLLCVVGGGFVLLRVFVPRKSAP